MAVATRNNAPAAEWQTRSLPEKQDSEVTSRAAFLSVLSQAWGKRTKLKTHPRTKHARADFEMTTPYIGRDGGDDVIYTHVKWDKPAREVEA